MKKEVKDTIIAELGQKLQEFPHFYLVDVTGLNAEKTSALRRKCFQSEIKMVVVKNSLLHKAFEASDIDFSELYGCLKGTTAVMFANTANVPAKLLKEYDKEGVPTLKAAYAEESFYVGADKLAIMTALLGPVTRTERARYRIPSIIIPRIKLDAKFSGIGTSVKILYSFSI